MFNLSCRLLYGYGELYFFANYMTSVLFRSHLNKNHIGTETSLKTISHHKFYLTLLFACVFRYIKSNFAVGVMRNSYVSI